MLAFGRSGGQIGIGRNFNRDLTKVIIIFWFQVNRCLRGPSDPSEVNWLTQSISSASLASSGFADSLANCNNVPGTDMEAGPTPERPSGLPDESEASGSDLGNRASPEDVVSSGGFPLLKLRQMNSRLLVR